MKTPRLVYIYKRKQSSGHSCRWAGKKNASSSALRQHHGEILVGDDYFRVPVYYKGSSESSPDIMSRLMHQPTPLLQKKEKNKINMRPPQTDGQECRLLPTLDSSFGGVQYPGSFFSRCVPHCQLFRATMTRYSVWVAAACSDGRGG